MAAGSEGWSARATGARCALALRRDRPKDGESLEAAHAAGAMGRGGFLPPELRIWEATRMGIAAWAVAGTLGYFLCARLEEIHAAQQSLAHACLSEPVRRYSAEVVPGNCLREGTHLLTQGDRGVPKLLSASMCGALCQQESH